MSSCVGWVNLLKVGDSSFPDVDDDTILASSDLATITGHSDRGAQSSKMRSEIRLNTRSILVCRLSLKIYDIYFVDTNDLIMPMLSSL